MKLAGWRDLVLTLALLGATVLTSVSYAASRRDTATSSSNRGARAAFAGTWVGHTRVLRINRSGRAKESIGSGCCDPVVDLELHLSRPRGNARRASIRARVTAVHVHDGSAYSDEYPAPHVGQTRRLRLRRGVITEPITGTNYCNRAAGLRGTCGA